METHAFVSRHTVQPGAFWPDFDMGQCVPHPGQLMPRTGICLGRALVRLGSEPVGEMCVIRVWSEVERSLRSS
jgi:hypothetical protein